MITALNDRDYPKCPMCSTYLTWNEDIGQYYCINCDGEWVQNILDNMDDSYDD